MVAKKCVVIDYGIGNVFSVMRGLSRLDCNAELTSNPDRIRNADRVILPGVGAFGRAANRLRSMGLTEVIHDYIKSGKPFLGICVGMQLLMETGEEFGHHQGLGLIPGTVQKIDATDEEGKKSRVPLIGWLQIEEAYTGSWAQTPFTADPSDSTFYFVHSFHSVVKDPSHRIAQHRLGDSLLTSAVRKDNVFGVQFHPERSAGPGQRFLAAFIE